MQKLNRKLLKKSAFSISLITPVIYGMMNEGRIVWEIPPMSMRRMGIACFFE
jgi:hypothetical protein